MGLSKDDSIKVEFKGYEAKKSDDRTSDKRGKKTTLRDF